MGVCREGGSDQSGGKTGQEKGGSISERNIDRCGKTPGSGNPLGPSVYLFLAVAVSRRPKARLRQVCAEPQTVGIRKDQSYRLRIKEGSPTSLWKNKCQGSQKPSEARVLPGPNTGHGRRRGWGLSVSHQGERKILSPVREA